MASTIMCSIIILVPLSFCWKVSTRIAYGTSVLVPREHEFTKLSTRCWFEAPTHIISFFLPLIYVKAEPRQLSGVLHLLSRIV